MMLKSLLMIANDTSNNGLHVGKVKVLIWGVFSISFKRTETNLYLSRVCLDRGRNPIYWLWFLVISAT